MKGSRQQEVWSDSRSGKFLQAAVWKVVGELKGGGGLWERAPTAPGDGLNWGERRDGDICMEPRGRRSWALASFSSQFKSGYPCFTNGNSGQTSNSPRWSACTMRMGGAAFLQDFWTMIR